MESRALVAESLLTGSQGTEVLGGFGNSLSIQTKHHATQWLTAMLNVEVDLVGDLGSLGRLGSLGEENQANSDKEGERGNESP